MALNAGFRWTLGATLMMATAAAAYPWPSWMAHAVFTADYNGYGNAKLTTLVSFGCRRASGVDHCKSNEPGYSGGSLPLAAPRFGDGGLIGTTSEPGTAYKLLPPGPGGTNWTATRLTGLADGTFTTLRQIGEEVLAGTEPNAAFLITNTHGEARKFIIYSFTGDAGGTEPLSGLTLSPNGVLYGTASGGQYGNGLVYALTPSFDGSYKQSVVFAFHAPMDGVMPGGGVALSQDGHLYGATASGGRLSCTYPQGGKTPGCGVLYRLTPPASGNGPWTETVLHRFAGGSDGAGPGGVELSPQNTLYGATIAGGTKSLGTVYEQQAAGGPSGYAVLWSFTGGSDGREPSTRVSIDPGGALYGTADGGTQNDGLVYILVPPYTGYSWQFSVLHNFAGNDGASPVGAPILDQAGTLYGTTLYGGAYDGGTVYQLVP